MSFRPGNGTVSTHLATAIAPANIAFIKYWGNRDPDLRLPVNDSLSMNLSAAVTRTTVAFQPHRDTDRIVIDGSVRAGPAADRVTRHIDLIRQRAGISARALVVSSSTFPAGTGIASSASGFAALTLASSAAAGLVLDERNLSALARRGSGSAARSVPGGFVVWRAAEHDEDSYAYSIAPPEHWDLHDLVAIVSREHKAVGSSDGHAAALLSPYYEARQVELRQRLPAVTRSLLDRDMATFGPALEAEAISLHVVAMTSHPPLLYWQPATLALMRQVPVWRGQGLVIYFTLDAGPNVHLLCEGHVAAAVETELSHLDYVEAVIHNRPAGPARLAQPPDEVTAQATGG
jgi:diphosphomevalonate decarboxylase